MGAEALCPGLGGDGEDGQEGCGGEETLGRSPRTRWPVCGGVRAPTLATWEARGADRRV